MAQANVVQSLFGPTPEELRRERELLQQQYIQNAARVSPSYSAGAGAGLLLGKLFGGALGVQSDEEAKAIKIQDILKGVVAELPEDMKTNRAAIMNRISQVMSESGDASLQQDAVKFAIQGAQFAKEDLESQTNIEYKNALIKSAEESVDRKNISMAYNAGQGLKSLLNNNIDPEKFDIAFNSTIEKLKKKGIDTSFLEQADNIEEKVAGVDYLISLGTSEKGRTSADIAAQKAGVQERLLQYRKILDQAKLDMQKYGIDSREGIAAKNRVAAMERAIVSASGANNRLEQTEKNLFIRDRLASRSDEIKNLDTEFQTQLDIKTIMEDTGLPMNAATGAVKNYQAILKDKLNMKDQEGLPLYTMAQAQDMARAEFAKDIKPKEGFFGKPSYQKGGNISTPLSKTEEDWIARASKANPGMSRQDIINQGISSGKIKKQ